MRKFLIFLLLFSLNPSLAAARLIIPTANLTIVVNNTGANEGLFHFDLKVLNGVAFEDFQGLDLQTSNLTATQTISIPTFGSAKYMIKETLLDGLSVGNSNCTGSNIDNNFSFSSNTIVITAGGNIVCTFNNFDPNLKTPVLILPGVLGSELTKGNNLLWSNLKMVYLPDSFMDPLAFNTDLKPSDPSLQVLDVIRSKDFGFIHYDYSDGLINDFVSQGYTEGKDLFTFPYDWRYGASGKDADGNFVNLKAFEGQLDYILTQTDAGKAAHKVDVIAHSTGGLIAKQYVINHTSDNKINKLVMVGVPNLGAPKAIKVLLQGDSFDIPGLSDAEMKKLTLNMPVAYDLSPSQKYYDQAGSYLHIKNLYNPSGPIEADLNFADAWTWMTDHNFANQLAINGASALHTSDFDNFDLAHSGVDLYNITGCTRATFSKINVNATKQDSGFSFSHLKLVTGDDTVPLVSAKSVNASPDHTFYAVGIEHGSLLSGNGSRQEIVNIVAGSNLNVDPTKIMSQQTLDKNPSLCNIRKGKFLGIFSPVSIEIVDQAGNRTGIADNGSIQNDVPGADYEIWGEHKFVYLPTDSGQTYTINLQGTGNGTFTLESADMENGNAGNTQSFVNVPVTASMKGQVVLTGDQTSLNLDNDGNGTIDKNLVPGDYTPKPPDPVPAPAPVSYGGGPAPTGIILTENHEGKVLGANKFANGMLILDSSDGRTVWLVVGGNKYGFTSEISFKKLGYKFENVNLGSVAEFATAGLITEDNFSLYN
jgi:pimeloyl-ACP methyl ester carboxylesterase